MRKVRTFIIISLIFCASIAAADEYIIQEGDTLWGISESHYNDTFLWPKLWKFNPHIENPDLIYPGTKISIPTKEELLGQAVTVPVVETEQPPVITPQVPVVEPTVEIPVEKPKPPKKFLIGKNVYNSLGWISAEKPGIGQIIASPTERNIFGSNDIVYLKADKDLISGDKFLTVRTIKKVKHPKTGKSMGYQIRVTGIVEVIGKDSGTPKSKVEYAFEDINIGDRIIALRETDPPLAPDVPRTPDIHGYIVESYMNDSITSAYKLIYLDKGLVDGLEAGDIFSLFSEEPVMHTMHTIGTMQIVSLQPATSTAIVLDSTKEITVGDMWGKKE
ncbi:MAG: LysM peptidoglycan-binding domain-containing protein [Nitrospirae bacterium]|nr:LysM peptidoglycan-binding domain-containing protein [Nitrospirota bacterium]